jgi:hypothetical protein
MASMQNCQQYSTLEQRQACRQFIINQYQKYQQHLQQQLLPQPSAAQAGGSEGRVKPVEEPVSAVAPLSDLFVTSQTELAEEVVKFAEVMQVQVVNTQDDSVSRAARETGKDADDVANQHRTDESAPTRKVVPAWQGTRML